MPKITAQIEVGTRFGKLTIVSNIYKIELRNRTYSAAKFKCDCGNIRELIVSKVTTGNTVSCGCFRKAIGQRTAADKITWTAEEIEYVRQNLNSMTYEQLGQKLGKTKKAVDYIVYRYKLRTSGPVERNIEEAPKFNMGEWSTEEQNYLLEHYETKTTGEIAAVLNRTVSGVYEKIKELELNLGVKVGDKFNYLTLMEKPYFKSGLTQNKLWGKFRCVCGREKDMLVTVIKNGNVISCGCQWKNKVRDTLSVRNRLHGGSNTKLHRIWNAMISRCKYLNESRQSKDYAQRGIKVCPEWLEKFENFRDWANANGYKDDLSLDRIDVNGNYESSNCRWTTASEQARNRRDTVNTILTAFGESKGIFDWIEDSRCVVNLSCLRYRISVGWNHEEAITTPSERAVKRKRRYKDKRVFVDKSPEARLISIWYGIQQRCFKPDSPYYHRYGGRGITVSEEWKDNSESFIRWSFKNGYNQNLSLDRIDNNGHYSPENCRWATPKEQAWNRCSNIKMEIEAFGEKKTWKEWFFDSRLERKKTDVIIAITKGVLPELAFIGISYKQYIKILAQEKILLCL